MTTERQKRIHADPIIISMIVTLGVLAVAIGRPLLKEHRAEEAWGELESRSESHTLIAGTYRSCANGGLTKHPAIVRCLREARDYAEIKGIETDFPTVLADMEATIESLR